jgi:hypothetical protein
MISFKEWASDLENLIQIDRDSIEFFRWAVEDEYEARWLDALLYYGERPDLLACEAREHLWELEQLEQRFIQLEEFEKCAAIRDAKVELSEKYQEWVQVSSKKV